MIVERNADARGQMPIRSLSTDVICPACGTRRLCDYPFEAGKRKRPDCKHEWKEKIEELEGQRITPEEAKEIFEDRIAYFDDEFDKGQQCIDEFVMGNANVHLETLDDTCLYIIVENGKHYWHFNVYHLGKSPLRVVMLEDNSASSKPL